MRKVEGRTWGRKGLFTGGNVHRNLAIECENSAGPSRRHGPIQDFEISVVDKGAKRRTPGTAVKKVKQKENKGWANADAKGKNMPFICVHSQKKKGRKGWMVSLGNRAVSSNLGIS